MFQSSKISTINFDYSFQISIPWQEGMEGKLAILVNGERVFLNDYSLQTVSSFC